MFLAHGFCIIDVGKIRLGFRSIDAGLTVSSLYGDERILFGDLRILIGQSVGLGVSIARRCVQNLSGGGPAFAFACHGLPPMQGDVSVWFLPGDQ